MTTYHLLPKGELWELTEEGDGSLAVFGTKEEAVAVCARTVERISGTLKIHRTDGTIEEERDYAVNCEGRLAPGFQH